MSRSASGSPLEVTGEVYEPAGERGQRTLSTVSRRQWVAALPCADPVDGHVDRLAAELTDRRYDPVVLIGGMGARARTAALARLGPVVDVSPLLVVATGPYIGEGFDCPVLDTLFLAAPISFSGRLVQYAGRVLRPRPGKEVAEVHDYVDVGVPVLASSMAKRARGYTSLGFPDPRRLEAATSSSGV